MPTRRFEGAIARVRAYEEVCRRLAVDPKDIFGGAWKPPPTAVPRRSVASRFSVAGRRECHEGHEASRGLLPSSEQGPPC
ncbi:hypothetical protein N7462_008322 [Penicillium macrosclerotiorum]|uniref:uncharacterized protein n=1 Tax=Penicillium macrosclerotiorum TaxID=303699 RepID=UPI002548410D|nr:uncharacterized protein N7462_008322 [Penicillium macrosclerotiorum]KAJ5675425.1 hypothetical protein N7462_008322 [Penicillium macrosclerotiorum]